MTYIPFSLKRRVIKRAKGHCEYCHFPQDASLLAFEMEHILAEKHGGETNFSNLALACPFCNRAKGTDLGSIDPETNKLTPFFNPRTQKWIEHFRFEGVKIIPLTAEGRVTVLILQFNHPDRLQERELLMGIGLFFL